MEASRPPASFAFEAPPHLLIVEARFYTDIADLQLQGVKTVLERVSATYEIVTVPGALEIPAAIAYALKALDFDPLRRRADGYIALGCVIKGGTMHDEIVGMESARGLQQLALSHALAIGNGILTCNSIEQALERADPARLNRSGEAAEAALRMIELKHHFRLSPKRRWVAK
ncbi:MAG: 6,7-dimethyl-8-ribityllumazine synthase [Alphaproteobacteria bacterium]|nr:6,7-dimethyl-8-ribityllumazine synthase [Alphaproteobacteria bacterium]